MTPEQRAAVSKSCNDEASGIYKPGGPLPNSVGLLGKLAIGAAVLGAGYLAYRWYRNKNR